MIEFVVRKWRRGRRRCFCIFLVPAVLLWACGPPAPAAEGRAGVVVVHDDGKITTACVAFKGPPMSGIDLLARSAIPHSTDGRNPMGSLVCEIEATGCSFPEKSCLCRCSTVGECTYWAYFTRGQSQDWQYSPIGASMRQLTDGDMDAWVWLSSGSTQASSAPQQLAAIAFENVCQDP